MADIKQVREREKEREGKKESKERREKIVT